MSSCPERRGNPHCVAYFPSCGRSVVFPDTFTDKLKYLFLPRRKTSQILLTSVSYHCSVQINTSQWPAEFFFRMRFLQQFARSLYAREGAGAPSGAPDYGTYQPSGTPHLTASSRINAGLGKIRLGSKIKAALEVAGNFVDGFEVPIPAR